MMLESDVIFCEIFEYSLGCLNYAAKAIKL